MTPRRAILAGLALLLIALLAWKWRALVPGVRPPAAAGTIAATSPSAAAPRRAPSPATERIHLADDLNAPASNIRADLQIVSSLLDAFRSNFPSSGNPVGNNAEITAALTGRNPLRLALIPRDHVAINRDGELCDRWGTPFFFHAESATRMEVRSAGPDRRMWTGDDVIQ